MISPSTGMLCRMSFEDLPPTWPSLPLSDPVLARDVLDLCVSHADRRRGGLSVLVLRSNLALAQPIFVAGAMPRAGRRPALSNLFQACAQQDCDTAFVLGIAHQGPALSDEDRALHQDVIEVCRELDFRLVSTHLVTAHAIVMLPVSRRAA